MEKSPINTDCMKDSLTVSVELFQEKIAWKVLDSFIASEMVNMQPNLVFRLWLRSRFSSFVAGYDWSVTALRPNKNSDAMKVIIMQFCCFTLPFLVPDVWQGVRHQDPAVLAVSLSLRPSAESTERGGVCFSVASGWLGHQSPSWSPPLPFSL